MVHEPRRREPEPGTDKSDGIARSESSRADLLNEWQPDRSQGFIGEEDDDQGREGKDEAAEKA